MTAKSCGCARRGCWYCTLSTVKMRVRATSREPSFFQRCGGGGCSGLTKKMPPRPRAGGHEIFFREGLLLRDADFLAGGDLFEAGVLGLGGVGFGAKLAGDFAQR